MREETSFGMPLMGAGRTGVKATSTSLPCVRSVTGIRSGSMPSAIASSMPTRLRNTGPTQRMPCALSRLM